MGNRLNIAIFSAAAIAAVSAYAFYNGSNADEYKDVELVAFSDLSQADIDAIEAVKLRMASATEIK